MSMNERLMQFRIGMFVIVAGLVLTMMIVWFGESPSILRDQVYLNVRYAEAPGVVEGVPVRKSGIRIGEVFATAFDERPNQPDGVIVTLALERRYKLHEGTVPRLNRSLIGDVTVDMMPGTGPAMLAGAKTPAEAPVIEGEVAPDPSKALSAVTKAFESTGDTLSAINEAANGLSRISKSTEKLDNFLTSVADAGRNVSKAAEGIERVIKANEADLQPIMADLRRVARKLDESIDQAALKAGIDRFSTAAARLDSGLVQLDPVLKDLGSPVSHRPTTDIGQAVRRINVVAADLELLTSKLRDGRGGLNTGGSLQKLITQAELHDNLNTMAVSATQALAQLKAVLNSIRAFVDKVSRDPSALTRGALQAR
jgi:phospholipid/cholesterol/gamma-HCH transport system substrate-binding protein